MEMPSRAVRLCHEGKRQTTAFRKHQVCLARTPTVPCLQKPRRWVRGPASLALLQAWHHSKPRMDSLSVHVLRHLSAPSPARSRDPSPSHSRLPRVRQLSNDQGCHARHHLPRCSQATLSRKPGSPPTLKVQGPASCSPK